MAASLPRLLAAVVQMTGLSLAIQWSSDAQTTAPQASAESAKAQPTQIKKIDKPSTDVKPSTGDLEGVCGNSLNLYELLEDSKAACDQVTWSKLPQKRRDQVLASSLTHTKANAERDHRFLLNMIPIMEFISQSESVTAYEGAHREGIGRFQKIDQADVIQFGNSSFHHQGISLSPEIQSIISDYRTFEAKEHSVTCVTNNRDVAFVFRKGDQTCEIIPCFECGDALIINGSNQIHAKLNIDAELRLISLLKSQFLHWPKHENLCGE